MPVALTILVGAQLVGEVLRRLLHLPLPGPVIGMFILAVALIIRSRGPSATSEAATQAGPSSLEKTATVLISNMGLLFVPAGVGIVAEFGVLRREWLPIAAGLLVSTVLGLIVTGVVMHRITGRAELDAAQAKNSQEVS
jgi:holin-like protein